MNSSDELQRVRERYDRRACVVPLDRYSIRRPENYMMVQERQRAILKLLGRWHSGEFAGLTCVEVGCGTGQNLLELLRFGFDPERLTGVELLSERLLKAKAVLPSTVALIGGDASTVEIPPASHDVVLQSVVFSSILCEEVRCELASAMWKWLRPGGIIIWYDFVYGNPSNPDVRGVRLGEVRRLFPEGVIRWHRVTLAPPLARLAVRLHPSMYTWLNSLYVFRTHIVCTIAKQPGCLEL